MKGDLVELSGERVSTLRRAWLVQNAARCPCCGAGGFRGVRRVAGEILHTCRRGHPYYVPGLP